MENKNIQALLDELASRLQQHDSLPQVYLDSHQVEKDTGETRSPMPGSQLRVNEGKLPEFLRQAGLRSMTINDPGNIETLMTAASDMAQQIGGAPGHYFRNVPFTRHLQSIFQHCSTIAFADWAHFANASDYWDIFFREVIKPLKTKGLEFIFYLGNITDRPVFMVDEMLDIMADFARKGRVTFIMDQQEMKKLWQAFHGLDTAKGDLWPFDMEEKYRSLFNTMNIHKLVVYGTNGVSLYSKEEQFNLTRRILAAHIEYGPLGRNDFISGYSLGLSLQLDSALCLTLGVAYFELKGQLERVPDRQELLNYIMAWRDQQGAVTA